MFTEDGKPPYDDPREHGPTMSLLGLVRHLAEMERATFRGMTELEKPPVLAARGGCWFRGGGLELHLGVEKDFRPAAKAHPGILVENLDALAKQLEASGCDVQWDPHFPGHRRFYSHDLHGNRVELLEPSADE
jgi:hypothetical protein